MKPFVYIGICLFSCIANAQMEFKSNHYGDPVKYTKDINKDGYIDSISYMYDGGSGFGGWNLALVNGKTRIVYEFTTFGTKWPTLVSVPIYPELETKENYPFLNEVAKCILPDIEVKTPEPCLKWILDGFQNFKRPASDTDLVEYAFKFDPIWSKGDIYLPKKYFIRLPNKEFNAAIHCTVVSEIPDWVNEGVDGWVICSAGNIHGNIKEKVDSYNDLELYKMHKAVILKKTNEYMWIFVDEGCLTGGDDKWGRIEHAAFLKEYVMVITYVENIYQFFLIDYHLGICAKLRNVDKRLTFMDHKIVWSNSNESAKLEKEAKDQMKALFK